MSLTNRVEEDEEEIEEEEESEDPEEASDDPDGVANTEAADGGGVACPECDAEIDEELSRGDLITCPECDCRLEVLDVDSAHLILYVPENERQQSDVSGRVVGERRPITNIEDDVAVSHTGLNPIVPELQGVTSFLDGHTSDAVADSVERENIALRDHTAFRIIDSQVRNSFRKQELISKIKNPGDKINEIIEAIVRDNEAEKINTSAELRRRVQEDVQAVYDASPARAKALERLQEASFEDKPDIDLTSMLPRWRRHPGGGTQTSNAGLDPLIQDAIRDAYEQMGVPASGSDRMENPRTLGFSEHPANDGRGDPEKHFPDEEQTDRSGNIKITWENWWQMLTDWTVWLRQPCPLSRKSQKLIQTAINILDECAWQAEIDERRTDKLVKRGPTGEVLLRGKEAVGLHGLNKALAEKLKITVREVEGMWREIKTLKRFPADKILERAER